MKLSEAIQTAKTEKPHSFSADHITMHVNALESAVQEFLEIPREEWVKYNWREDGDKELIAKAPHDYIYVLYIKAKVDYDLEEYESYANNQAMFEANFADWKASVLRAGEVRPSEVQIKNWW